MLTIYTDESRLVGKEIKRRIDSLFNGRITESDIDNTAAQLIKRIGLSRASYRCLRQLLTDLFSLYILIIEDF